LDQASALLAQKRPGEAARIYLHTLRIMPNSEAAYHGLGDALQGLGRYQDAVRAYRQALSLNGDSPDSHNNLANSLQILGQFDEAAAHYRRAIELQPDLAPAWSNLALLLQSQGRMDEALQHHRRAADLMPAHTLILNNLAYALIAEKQYAEAMTVCQRVIELNPKYAPAYNHLGVTYDRLGQFQEAGTSYRNALSLDPRMADAHNNLGHLIERQGRLDEAAEHYRIALGIEPNVAEVHNNLGNVLAAQGLIEEAVSAYRRALESRPNYVDAHSNLLFTLNYSEVHTPESVFEEHRRFGAVHELRVRSDVLPHANTPDTMRRIKLGYLSPDLRKHSVAYFMEPILACHNRWEYELHAYYNHPTADEVTERIRRSFDHWVDCFGMSDSELARRIRADGIDILVDLAGHTAGNRILVLARKPAPIQVLWIGYPNTTGLSAMDYRLSDEVFDPPGQTEYLSTEQIVRLPTRYCFQPPPEAPPVTSLPALSRGYVSFASFNVFNKIGSKVLLTWAQILQAVPDSRLLIANVKTDTTADRVQAFFREHGIERERLTLIDRVAFDDYLALHDRIDLCLDSFPFNGGTTTFLSLWMGVPIITLEGRHAAGRQGVTILGHLGLPELVATSTQEYVAIARHLAADLPALNRLRMSLRQRLASSSLLRPEETARAAEEAFREMWVRWCLQQEQSVMSGP
jgi:predicted O-linked N-acetylglucosamine transferase (SPINDLY family)